MLEGNWIRATRALISKPFWLNDDQTCKKVKVVVSFLVEYRLTHRRASSVEGGRGAREPHVSGGALGQARAMESAIGRRARWLLHLTIAGVRHHDKQRTQPKEESWGCNQLASILHSTVTKARLGWCYLLTALPAHMPEELHPKTRDRVRFLRI